LHSDRSQKWLHPRAGGVFPPVWYAVFMLMYTDFCLGKSPGGKMGCEYQNKDINGMEEHHTGGIDTENGLGHRPGLCFPYTEERPAFNKT